MDIATAVDTVKSLDQDEQLEVVDRILAGLPDDSSDELTPELMAELDRRIGRYRANPETALPFEEVSCRAKARWEG